MASYQFDVSLSFHVTRMTIWRLRICLMITDTLVIVVFAEKVNKLFCVTTRPAAGKHAFMSDLFTPMRC